MASLNEAGKPSLYERRKGVYPKAVDGFFRRLKWGVMILTLAIYYLTPWIRWDRGPYAPNQAVLVDLAHRRFYMFAIEIWPHEFYYVTGLLVMAGIGLFLVTSAVGRAWCGYACPQTVWTDLFQHVERWIDGDRNAQIRLAQSPLTLGKLARRLSKWTVWLAIAAATGGAWIFYFADAPTLATQLADGNAPVISYTTIGILTATTFVLGGFMREQVCIYMCPWPRIQTAMLDERSLLVTYKDWRGEPRTHGLKKQAASLPATGDCIDCLQCVSVCPTGIDIREGPQIGCITCALCIDACDKVMAQIGRPRGLIDYCTLDDASAEKRGAQPQSVIRTLLRPRTIVYFAVWSLIGGAMLFSLGARTRLDLSIQHERNPIYVRLADGSVRNNYTIKVRNMEARPRTIELRLEGLEGARIWDANGNRGAATRTLRVAVEPDSVTKIRAFVSMPVSVERAVFSIAASGGGGRRDGDVDETIFEGPSAPTS